MKIESNQSGHPGLLPPPSSPNTTNSLNRRVETLGSQQHAHQHRLEIPWKRIAIIIASSILFACALAATIALAAGASISFSAIILCGIGAGLIASMMAIPEEIARPNSKL